MPAESARRQLFREVNGQIQAINERFGAGFGTYDILCECGSEDCMQRVEVPRALYERVRADGSRYVLAPGHRGLPGDRLVVEESTYSVVAPQPRLVAAAS